MPEIVDVIAQKCPYTTKLRYFIVVDRDPDYRYERRGNLAIAHDSGCWDTLVHSPGSSRAFAGREFDIPFLDGSIVRARGDWWSSGQNEIPEPIVQCGVASLDKLEECYVFIGCYFSRAKLDAWLAENAPTDKYYKYNLPRPWLLSWMEQRVEGRPLIEMARSFQTKAKALKVASEKSNPRLFWCAPQGRRFELRRAL